MKLVVFISCPAGTEQEKAALLDVLHQINAAPMGLDFVLMPWTWDAHSADRIGGPAQENIDHQLPQYDVYIGIMSRRFGSRTKGYGSGTEAEFREARRRAEQAHARNDDRPWVQFYFRENPPPPEITSEAELDEDTAQYRQVLKLKGELKPDKDGCYRTYKDVADFKEQVSQQLRHIVGVLAGGSPAAVLPGQAIVPPEYRQWLLRECDEVDLAGLGLKEGVPSKLTQVYVPLTTTPSQKELAEGQDPQALARRATPEGGEARQPLILDLLGDESLYVPGDAGTGKSTFCRWLAMSVAHGHVAVQPIEPQEEQYRETLPAALKDRLPVLVRLRGFGKYVYRHWKQSRAKELPLHDLKAVIRHWLEEQTSENELQGLDWPTLEAHIDQGTALLLFDGVDEVPLSESDEQGRVCHVRELLLDGLGRAVKVWGAKGNRLLVTSRPYGLDDADVQALGLREAKIMDLPDALQQLLVKRWFAILQGDAVQAERTAARLFGEVREREGLDALIANPLLLTATCILYSSEGKKLPSDKFDLYERLVERVLHRLPKEKRPDAHNDLQAIAHSMHTGEHLDAPDNRRTRPHERISNHELDKIIAIERTKRKLPADQVTVENWRNDLLTHSGLLRSCGVKLAEFAHLTFQDFLAATRILNDHLDKPDGKGWPGVLNVFLHRYGEPHWHRALVFLFAGRLKDNTPADYPVWLAGQLIDHVPSQPPDQTLELKVVLAECLLILLGKRRDALPEERRAQFTQICLQAIDDEVSLPHRQKLGLCLGELGDPRVALDLSRAEAKSANGQAAFVRIPPGSYLVGDEKQPCELKHAFLLSRYLVTNSQYAVFVAAGGYDEPRWWSPEGWQWRQDKTAGHDRSEPRYWQSAKWKGANQPVVGVSFFEAEAFAHWADGRLPTADESEAAARGPCGLVYPWGDDWDSQADKDRCNWHGAGLDATSPVGILPRARSQPFGLEDAAGNAWEWCADVGVVDWLPERPEGRVVRGGAFVNDARNVRAAYRGHGRPGVRIYDVGFRLARTLNDH